MLISYKKEHLTLNINIEIPIKTTKIEKSDKFTTI